MLVAHWEGQRVEATNAAREISYECPKCKGPVVLKRGRIVIPHFAHKPPVTCDWAKGETMAHLEAKRLFADAFASRGLRVEVEYVVPALPSYRRADVMVWSKKGNPVAIEIQHTSIGIEEIETRAFAYAGAGISQLWIPVLNPGAWETAEQIEDDGAKKQYLVERYAAKPFEKWIHGLNHGHVMFYDPRIKALWSGLFEGHHITGGGNSWYDSEGNEQYSSAYSRWSRRWRELTLRGPFQLDEIWLRPKRRQAHKTHLYRWPAGGIVEVLTRKRPALPPLP